MKKLTLLNLTLFAMSLFFLGSCEKDDDKTAKLTFKVVNTESAVIPEAKISINKQELTTDAEGISTIELDEGSYNYVVKKEGFSDFTGTVVMDGKDLTEPIELSETIITGNFELNVQDRTKWYYFSFTDGLVGEGSADPADGDDATWKEKNNWDLAFHYYNVRTNSGLSGNGQGAANKTDFTSLEGVLNAPETGYIIDTEIEIYLTGAMPPPLPTISSGNEAINKWAVFDHPNMVWNVPENIYIVKTANGNYAKLKFTNFLDENDTSGLIKLDFVLQTDGTMNF